MPQVRPLPCHSLRRLRGAALYAVVVLAASTLTGCGTATVDPSGRSASASPSGDATPSATDSAAIAADSRLLPASALPDGPWKEGLTDNSAAEPFGPCAKFSMLSIGGGTVVERAYTSHDGRQAAEQVVHFPDAKTGWRAGKVLDAWRQECLAKPTDPRKVTVAHGTASAYQATVGGTKIGFGVVRDGATMALVTVEPADAGGDDAARLLAAASKQLHP